jgi:hypothetical protein
LSPTSAKRPEQVDLRGYDQTVHLGQIGLGLGEGALGI